MQHAIKKQILKQHVLMNTLPNCFTQFKTIRQVFSLSLVFSEPAAGHAG